METYTFGARNDNSVLLEHQIKFFNTQFFPYLEKNGISDIFILGDILDRRKYANISTVNYIRKHVIETLSRYYVYMLVGNHDAYNSNSLEVNSLEEIVQVKDGKKFAIISNPQEVKFTWGNVLLLPWICMENEKRSLELIQQTNAKVCFGHLELKGFESHAGHIIDTGLDISCLSKFRLVAASHIHKRQHVDNIFYLGSPYQITWADFDSPKGFHILDTNTLQLTFIRNPNELFHKIIYDDNGQSLDQVLNWDFEKLKDCYIKVLVQDKTNPYHFDMFIEALEKYAVDVKIIEDSLQQQVANNVNLNDQCENTVTILKKFVEQSNLPGDKKMLDNLLVGLYNSALLTMDE